MGRNSDGDDNLKAIVPGAKSLVAESSVDKNAIITIARDTFLYGYDPVTFEFDSKLVHARWETFKQQKPLNQLGFWAVGILAFTQGPFVVQWRGLNGDLGWLWMIQTHFTFYCIILWYVILFFESRRRQAELYVRYWCPLVDAHAAVAYVRMECIRTYMLINPFNHMSFLLRSYTMCSSAEAANAFDVMFCNGTHSELPADGFLAMIVLGLLHQWIYAVPWKQIVFNYLVGLVWTLLAIRYQRNRDECGVTVSQQNLHMGYLLSYLSVSVLHYHLHAVMVAEFIAHDRKSNPPDSTATSTTASVASDTLLSPQDPDTRPKSASPSSSSSPPPHHRSRSPVGQGRNTPSHAHSHSHSNSTHSGSVALNPYTDGGGDGGGGGGGDVTSSNSVRPVSSDHSIDPPAPSPPTLPTDSDSNSSSSSNNNSNSNSDRHVILPALPADSNSDRRVRSETDDSASTPTTTSTISSSAPSSITLVTSSASLRRTPSPSPEEGRGRALSIADADAVVVERPLSDDDDDAILSYCSVARTATY